MIPTKKDWEALLEARHGKERQRAISNSCVAVCGLGGLGSEIATILARAGVGCLILCDFDKVDLPNLHRQQYKLSQLGKYKTESLAENIREFAPYCKLILHRKRIATENFAEILSEADVICEAFDSPESKAMLADAVLCRFADKYYIAASGMAGFGNANEITTRRVTRKFYICGDGKSELSENCSIIASRVSLCAAHQAHLALQIISGELKD